ncbi:hypothetical protein NFJ02_20g42410 [Pycnococcus provasolii]
MPTYNLNLALGHARLRALVAVDKRIVLGVDDAEQRALVVPLSSSPSRKATRTPSTTCTTATTKLSTSGGALLSINSAACTWTESRS